MFDDRMLRSRSFSGNFRSFVHSSSSICIAMSVVFVRKLNASAFACLELLTAISMMSCHSPLSRTALRFLPSSMKPLYAQHQ